jgi:phospholipid/cholesterol/gamma-HCH transport system substrate-binding protein
MPHEPSAESASSPARSDESPARFGEAHARSAESHHARSEETQARSDESQERADGSPARSGEPRARSGRPPARASALKVGLLVVIALAVLAAGVALIGNQESLFVRKNRYYIRFNDVEGLAPGNVVQLNGVNVGKVAEVTLPEDPNRAEVRVWVEIDRHYAQRLRAPEGSTPPIPGPVPVTRAELKTQGLLGDKYVALTVGSPKYPAIPVKGEILAFTPISVQALVASGGDVMAQAREITHNLSQASRDLAVFTASLNRGGGGLVPRLLGDQAYGREITDKLRKTVDNLAMVTGKVASGQGTLGKLVQDPQIYDALNNMVVGVNQNKMLRWLVQNRQKAGIAKRYQDATKGQSAGSPAPRTPSKGKQPAPQPPPSR